MITMYDDVEIIEIDQEHQLIEFRYELFFNDGSERFQIYTFGGNCYTFGEMRNIIGWLEEINEDCTACTCNEYYNGGHSINIYDIPDCDSDKLIEDCEEEINEVIKSYTDGLEEIKDIRDYYTYPTGIYVRRLNYAELGK